MERGAWWAAVHGVTKSQAPRSDWHLKGRKGKSGGEFSLEMGQRSADSKLRKIEFRRVNILIPFTTWVGVLVPAELKHAYSLRNQDAAPRLHYCFLTAPLSLHSLPSLISSCLNLRFGIQGRSRTLTETYFLWRRNREDLYWEPLRVLLVSTSLFLYHWRGRWSNH